MVRILLGPSVTFATGCLRHAAMTIRCGYFDCGPSGLRLGLFDGENVANVLPHHHTRTRGSMGERPGMVAGERLLFVCVRAWEHA
jgi:hypothetical protein